MSVPYPGYRYIPEKCECGGLMSKPYTVIFEQEIPGRHAPRRTEKLEVFCYKCGKKKTIT